MRSPRRRHSTASGWPAAGVRRPDKTLATADHNTPTDGTMAARLIADQLSRVQVETLERNCEEFGIKLYSLGSDRQGIVHVIGPELGVTQPGMTIVCGDSHTSTHGAFGSLAFGIGTSEVEHVLATQCLVQKRAEHDADLLRRASCAPGVTPKDLILATIGRLGTGGMTGYAVEYAGPAIEALSMPGRMTVCNMTIEGGGRAGMIAPDETTFELVRGRPGAPQDFDAAVARWRELPTETGAELRQEVEVDAASLSPMVTWGTNPGMVVEVTDSRPRPGRDWTPRPTANRPSAPSAYMALAARHADDRDRPGTGLHRLLHQQPNRGPARGGRGCRRPQGRDSVRAMVVPGSQAGQSEPPRQEGLDDVFRSAGFEWREAGCSMCLGMNPDTLAEGERCASTSNRNFEGRQGKGGRTHLVSPRMAAAAAVEGHFVDIRDWS